MLRFKKSIFILFAAIIVFSLSCCANNNSKSSPALWADGDPMVASTDQNSLDAVKWFSSKDKGKEITKTGSSSLHYYLLLPSCVDLNNLTLWHTFPKNPSIDGTEIISGTTTNAIHGEGDYSLTAGEKTYTLTIKKSDSIGSIYINTDSGNMTSIHKNREYKESGQILVAQPNGTADYNGTLSHIKGRGNSTWKNIEKKPYNIKLEEKASLFGMDKSKKWCLLANGQDHTLLRNKIAYDLGDEIGIDYSPDSAFADLYLNGEYAGVYQITEKIEVGKNNLVKINDLASLTEKANDTDIETYRQVFSGDIKYCDIPNNPDDITGGYLLEWEVNNKFTDAPSGFKTNLGQFVVVRSPEYASKAQTEYIKNFVQDMEDAIYSENGTNSKGKYYTDYIDIQSAALMYLIQEYSLNIDSGITSCFFYKESDSNGDGKIHASPVWDFDVAFGNLEDSKDGVPMVSTNMLFAQNAYQYVNGQRTIFSQLCQHSDFIDTVKKLYQERFKNAVDILNSNENTSGEYICSYSKYRELLGSSPEMNFIRWKIKDHLLVPSAGYTYKEQISYLKFFTTERAGLLNKEFLDKKSDIVQNTSDGYTVYFKNVKKWDEVYIYYWQGTKQYAWPGQRMQPVDETNGIYKYDFSVNGETDNGKLMIVFNNGQGEQTEDLHVVNHSIYTPSSVPYKTNNDSTYYMCTMSEYNEINSQ